VTAEVLVLDTVRTPVGRHGGALAGTRPDDLAAHVLRALLARQPALDPAGVDDVVFGNGNGAGEENRDVARMAALLAGLPTSVPGVTGQPAVRVGPGGGRPGRPGRSPWARRRWCWPAGSSR
jgi:acetyl-CoA acetyltransferase